VLNRFGGRWAEMRCKPGTDTEFPAQFAGNWLSVGMGVPPAKLHEKLASWERRKR
jgi:hypothetical protein